MTSQVSQKVVLSEALTCLVGKLWSICSTDYLISHLLGQASRFQSKAQAVQVVKGKVHCSLDQKFEDLEKSLDSVVCQSLPRLDRISVIRLTSLN